MSDRPVPDTDSALDFLMRYSGNDPIMLTAIVPDGGGVESLTVRPETESEKARQWIDKNQGRYNIYFTVNPTIRPMSGQSIKAKKTDIRALKALHVDIDPRVGEDFAAERERAVRVLQNFNPPASIIIDSGNGFQGFWLLAEEQPVDGQEERAVELERYSQHIALKLTADNCHNIDRVMRLPGTINIPGKTKLKKGRVPVLASLFSADWDARYPLSLFVAAPLRRSMATAPGTAVVKLRAPSGPVDLDTLPKTVSDLTKAIIIHGFDPDKPNAKPSRSEPLLRVCCDLVRAQVDDEIIYAIIIDPNFGISASVLEANKPDEYAMRQVRRAHEKVGEARQTNRPVVMLIEHELHRVLDEVEAGLVAMEAPLYQMAGRLVQVERKEVPLPGGDAASSPGGFIIKDVSDHRLRERMIEFVEFRRPKDDKDDDGSTSIVSPTLAHAKHLQARSDKWTFRPLRAVVETPTLRADGSLIQQEGYDAASGFVLNFGGVEFPPIPESPSRDEALAALAKLREPIAGFPFVPEPGSPNASSSRSVALSAILTALCRRSLRTAPLHAFTAPTMATGKSLLADVVSIIATGRSATVISQGKTEEEEEKRLLALLMQGEPILIVDNIERPISGDALCTILTQEQWQSRLLGQSKQMQVSTNVLFLATGNNLTFKGDMSTRAIIARMDAGLESPEARVFTGDLRKQVRAIRPALVAAGLTVLRAFHATGLPGLDLFTPFGRFEPWSDLVRGALIWLGEADPCLSRSLVAQRDLARDEHSELLEVWRRVIGVGSVVKAAEVIVAASRDDGLLKEVLESICPHGATSKRLGHYLTKIEGRWLNGLCIEQLPDKKQGASYRLLERTEKDAPAQGALDLPAGVQGINGVPF